MANTLKFGNGQWATGNGTALAYNDENANFKPLPFDFTRASSGTTVNQSGLIETIGSGIPRIDFQGNTKGALLLEPQRSNSLPYSADFSTWSATGGASVIGNKLGVGGSNDAFEFLSNGTANTRLYYALSNTGELSFSVFAKKNTLDYIALYGNGGSNPRVWFNLANGTLGNQEGAGTGSIESYGNGWYRCTMHWNSASLVNVRIYNSNANDVFGGTVGSVFIQYAQLEEGSYATSYIPTSGSAVTRVADSCSQTLPNAVFNSYPFSVFAEVDVDDINNGFAFSLLNKSSTNNYFTAEYYSNQWHIVARPSGTSIIISSSATPTKGTHKIVGVYTDTDLKLYLNGSLIASGSNSLPFNTNIDSLLLGQLRTVTDTGTRNSTRQVLLYNTELTNAEAIALTQV